MRPDLVKPNRRHIPDHLRGLWQVQLDFHLKAAAEHRAKMEDCQREGLAVTALSHAEAVASHQDWAHIYRSRLKLE